MSLFWTQFLPITTNFIVTQVPHLERLVKFGDEPYKFHREGKTFLLNCISLLKVVIFIHKTVKQDTTLYNLSHVDPMGAEIVSLSKTLAVTYLWLRQPCCCFFVYLKYKLIWPDKKRGLTEKL